MIEYRESMPFTVSDVRINAPSRGAESRSGRPRDAPLAPELILNAEGQPPPAAVRGKGESRTCPSPMTWASTRGHELASERGLSDTDPASARLIAEGYRRMTRRRLELAGEMCEALDELVLAGSAATSNGRRRRRLDAAAGRDSAGRSWRPRRRAPPRADAPARESELVTRPVELAMRSRTCSRQLGIPYYLAGSLGLVDPREPRGDARQSTRRGIGGQPGGPFAARWEVPTTEELRRSRVPAWGRMRSGWRAPRTRSGQARLVPAAVATLLEQALAEARD